MINVCAVVGPTAVGKTASAIEIAKALNGEIVSCDSMQIYKKMDIGTAKPTKEELAEVPHHMIDICDSCDNFSCAEFIERAGKIVDDIAARGCLPIICGGTGLYVDTLLNGTNISPAGADEALRNELEKQSSESLYEELCRVDAESAEKTHMNNRKRVIRALEIYRTTGMTKTEWDRRSQGERKYRPIYIGLDCMDRELLYSRIDSRVELMFEVGLLEEVRSLYGKMSDTASQAIGYKELISYIDGVCSLDDAKEKIKQSSRNYAKRQLTWFKRNKDTKWFFTDNGLDTTAIIETVRKELE
ncbi:MAG: tRNA (adenosine(37)-N6)-dimethylallyltransferase MiaA [Ruminococcaceae bacterium]|nr:tRNA (adenosine(37)-N6)-dimethylallyltransferase MiaA [Oscillospiraceae bacterium]